MHVASDECGGSITLRMFRDPEFRAKMHASDRIQQAWKSYKARRATLRLLQNMVRVCVLKYPCAARLPRMGSVASARIPFTLHPPTCPL